MIQRKQTLFLLVAVIASLLCFFMPIGVILPKGMGGVVSLYNLGFVDDNGTITVSGTCLPLLFCLLSLQPCRWRQYSCIKTASCSCHFVPLICCSLYCGT